VTVCPRRVFGGEFRRENPTANVQSKYSGEPQVSSNEELAHWQRKLARGRLIVPGVHPTLQSLPLDFSIGDS